MIRKARFAVLLVLSGVFAQTASPPLTFEVASIKPVTLSGDGRFMVGIQIQPGGGFRATNTSLRMLLTYAYDVRDFQISGGPGWLRSDLFDIMAKSERSADSQNAPADPRQMNDDQRKTLQEQTRQKLQALLVDRFHLKVHRESKEQPVYALLVGKNGPKLQPSEDKSGSGPRGLRMGRGQLTGSVVSLEMLANALSNQVGRPVLDRTGLKGNFDFKLEWTPDPGQGGGPFAGLPPPPPGVNAPPPPDPNGPSIFTAIQEQLGLRLESQKGPVDILVIDSVEKPSEN
ncbi:MAG TPA: TIGR03435 family protein [Bryobacteraceae bacterium]|nr:TIGR03435 family protein [Bryobacteraceae bacterium]